MLGSHAVHEQVIAACTKNPNAVALDFLGGTTSFGELSKSIVAFAGALQSQYGVNKGSRVALLLPNTPFYAVAYYGVLLCVSNSPYTIKTASLLWFLLGALSAARDPAIVSVRRLPYRRRDWAGARAACRVS